MQVAVRSQAKRRKKMQPRISLILRTWLVELFLPPAKIRIHEIREISGVFSLRSSQWI